MVTPLGTITLTFYASSSELSLFSLFVCDTIVCRRIGSSNKVSSSIKSTLLLSSSKKLKSSLKLLYNHPLVLVNLPNGKICANDTLIQSKDINCSLGAHYICTQWLTFKSVTNLEVNNIIPLIHKGFIWRTPIVWHILNKLSIL